MELAVTPRALEPELATLVAVAAVVVVELEEFDEQLASRSAPTASDADIPTQRRGVDLMSWFPSFVLPLSHVGAAHHFGQLCALWLLPHRILDPAGQLTPR